MAWSERQHRMLRAIGLRVWTPPAPQAQDAAAVANPAANAAAVRPAAPPPAATRTPAAQAAPPPAVAPAPAPALRPVHHAPAVAAAPAANDDERARHIATLDWPALRESVQQCRACALCESRTQTVFGVGHAQAHWMVVGEAPGEQEDRLGEPFVGPSGELLDNMLRALSLTRSVEGEMPPARRVHIVNTLKCRPPRNRNPAPDELLKCEPFLMRQIALVQPRIILAMGRFAVQALLRSSEPVGRLRGRVHRYQGVPLVVTYHPAYLLRNLTDKARAWEDLCLAAEVADQVVAEGADDGAFPEPAP